MQTAKKWEDVMEDIKHGVKLNQVCCIDSLLVLVVITSSLEYSFMHNNVMHCLSTLVCTEIITVYKIDMAIYFL